MPAIVADLITEIRKFSDEKFESFIRFPKDDPDTADLWSNAIFTYAAKITTPPFLPPGHLAGKEAFKAAMAGASLPGAAIAILPLALAAYAGALAGTGAAFGASPPPAPFVTPVIPPNTNAQASATTMATAIDTWFKTGIFTLPPPGGTWL